MNEMSLYRDYTRTKRFKVVAGCLLVLLIILILVVYAFNRMS